MLGFLKVNKRKKELNDEVEKLNQELIEKENIKLRYSSEIDDLIQKKEELEKIIRELIKKENAQRIETENSIKKLVKEEKIQIEKNKLQIKKLRETENFFIESYMDAIDSLSGLDFENFMCEILNKIGFEAVVTKASGDNGADIIAKDNFKKYAIQCKRYTGRVGFDAVKEVHAAKDIYNCDLGVILTNADDFTKEAIENSRKLNIKLWNRDKIKNMLAKAYEIDIYNLEKGKKIIENENIDINDVADDCDEFLIEAIDLVIEIGSASASVIQRNFKVGYARAARIIDQMEERGVISGYQGSKPREVLITKKEWMELKNSINNY